MDQKEEKLLIQNAQSDPEAFGELYDIYYPKIGRYVIHRIDDSAAAEDIISQIFFKALEKIHQFRWQGVSFGAWLYRIAGNEINDYYRSGSKAPVSMEEGMGQAAYNVADAVTPEVEFVTRESSEEASLNSEALHMRIKQLPVVYQEVIALKYFENKKIREIADILDKKEGTVKSLLSRGIDSLAKIMS